MSPAGETPTRPAAAPQPPDLAELAIILDYVTRYGWEVFPCYSVKRNAAGEWICTCKEGAACANPGKHPLYHPDDLAHGHNSASSDPAQIRTWAKRWPDANWARRPGPDEFVLDIDAKPDEEKDGRPWLAANREFIPPTLTTRRGDGQHFHLRAPVGTPIRNSAGEIAPGVDVCSHKGYIMLPPSQHVSGDPYEWVEGAGPEDRAPALASWGLLLLVAKLPKPDPPPALQVGSPSVPCADETPVDREWLLRKYIAAAGGRRHNAGLDLACQLRDNCFSEGDAESIMREYHSAVANKGDHPYTWDDALRTLRDVYRRPARQPLTGGRTAPAPALQVGSPIDTPVDPDTGEIAGPVDPALVQQLAVQIAALTARAERAEAAFAQVRWLWERERRLMALPNVTNANLLRTASVMLPVLDAQIRKAGSVGARVRAIIHEYARLSHQTPVKVGRDIQKMHKLGWLVREEVKEDPEPLPGQTPNGAEPITVQTKDGKRKLRLKAPRPKVTHIYITLAPGFLEVDPTLLAPATKGEWGSPKGRRPKRCKACGSRRMQAVTYRCMDCGHEQPADLEAEAEIQDGAPEAAPVQVAAPVDEAEAEVQDGAPATTPAQAPAPVDGIEVHTAVDPDSGFMGSQDVQPAAPARTTAAPAGKTPPARSCPHCGCTEWRWWDTGGWFLTCWDNAGQCRGRTAS